MLLPSTTIPTHKCAQYDELFTAWIMKYDFPQTDNDEYRELDAHWQSCKDCLLAMKHNLTGAPTYRVASSNLIDALLEKAS